MKLIPALVVLSLALSLCNLAEKLSGNKNGNTNSSTANSNGGGDKGGLPPADKPEPTDAETAAIAGGKSLSWDQQGITWTVPANWSKLSQDSTTLSWKSPGSADAGFIIGNISVMKDDFPEDISIKAMYDSAIGDKKNGKYAQVRWLELDGVRGIETLEAVPEHKDDQRRLEWQGYRKYAGQKQLVILILNSQGQHFDKHKDELHGILYSTKLVHD